MAVDSSPLARPAEILDPVPSFPRLAPATRLLWRSERCVQLELGSRAVLVDGLASGDVRHLTGQPGAVIRGGTEQAYAALLEAGFLWPAAETSDDLRLAPPVPRLQAELAALTARHSDAAAELLQARRDRAVVIFGDGRGATLLAAVLAAAGIGRVSSAEPGTVRLQQAVPGGVGPGDEGHDLARATAAAVVRAAPEVDTTPLPLVERPDLVVLAQEGPVDDERRDALHARDCAHLLLRVGPGFGTVGPLVVPGLTACLRCADLHRLDRDPAWNALAVQIGTARRATSACEVAVAVAIAGLAAIQVLAFLDGEEPATVDGSIELHLPAWRLRRRSWPAHPACGCTR